MSNQKPKPKTAIELLRDAHKVPSKAIDIPLTDDQVIEAQLTAPDIWDIQDEIDEVYQELYDKYVGKGWDKKPINEGAWQSELANYPEESKKQLTKPANLAEQKADEKAKSVAMRQIIPKYLSYRDSGEPLFPDSKSLAEGTKILSSKIGIFTMLANAFVELSTQITKDQEAVKN
jgi:hypothetical protein